MTARACLELLDGSQKLDRRRWGGERICIAHACYYSTLELGL